MTLIVAGVCVGLGSRVFAASDAYVSVASSADRTVVRIGDAITYRVTVEYDSTLALVAANPGEALARFDVRDHRTEQNEGTGRKRSVTEEFILAAYDIGTQTIGSRLYMVENLEGALDTLVTVKIPIVVVPTLPADAEDIRDIKGPAGIEAERSPGWVVGMGVGVLTGIVALIWFIRSRESIVEGLEMPPPRPAHEVAYETLEELRSLDLPGSGEMRAYYIALSETLRRYLGARFHLPAMDRTTAELVLLLRGGPSDRDTIGRIREILDTSDRAKFARWVGTLEDATRMMAAALEVVDTTKERVLGVSDESAVAATPVQPESARSA